MVIRKIEHQFNSKDAAALRAIQHRLIEFRITGKASDFFIYEAIHSLEIGRILTTLLLTTAAIELRAREILTNLRIRQSKEIVKKAFAVEVSIEEDKSLAFYGIISALNSAHVFGPGEFDVLKNIYINIRIPLHHGIVRRYIQQRDEPGVWDGELFVTLKANSTTSQSELEDAIDKHGISDLSKVIDGMSIITDIFFKYPTEKNQV